MRRTFDHKLMNIVTDSLSIVHCPVRFCLLHHVYEGMSRFIETGLGEAIGNINSILYIIAYKAGKLTCSCQAQNTQSADFAWNMT